MADSTRHMAHDVTDQVSDTMRSATGRTMDMGRQVQDRVGRMMDEQPLVMGAVGLFIGAAIGALLPSTRAENRLMGDTADKVKDRATGLAAEQFERAQEVAGEVIDRVKEEAESQGLTLDAAKDKARAAASEIGEKVQAVAGKATEAAAGAAGVDNGTPEAGKPGAGTQRAPGQTGPGRQGEAGVRSPADPVVTRTPGGSAFGGEAGASPRGPSPAAAQPSVVSPPPTGPGTSAGQASTGAGVGKPKGGGTLV
jgi:ElaB/YqjD/DUF883 family membrane-anchored ribosome-binding protein